MSLESAESNVVVADFREHRRNIAVENSPFGPVLAGIVEVELPPLEDTYPSSYDPKKPLMSQALGIVAPELLAQQYKWMEEIAESEADTLEIRRIRQ